MEPRLKQSCRNKTALSKRLFAVADMVEPGSIVCDVGCDHGFVPICLVEKGISDRVIAMDVNIGPLMAAKRHIREHALEDYIETRLSDGLRKLGQGEADTLICAGMGGRLTIRILTEGEEKVRAMKGLILQPQSALREVRKYLRYEGYDITDENMIFEDGKYYPVIKACPAEKRPAVITLYAQDDPWQRVEDLYGPVLLARRHGILLRYLEREERICRQILAGMDGNARQEKRRGEMAERLADIKLAFSCYEN